MRGKAALLALLLCSVAFEAAAQSGDAPTTEEVSQQGLKELVCPSANIMGTSMVTDVCWDCIFPIRLGGVPIMGGSGAPDDAADNPICACGSGEGALVGKIGITVGFWSPQRLIESVHRPYCFPSMGGQMISDLASLGGSLDVGVSARPQPNANQKNAGYMQTHYYAFPLTAILQLFDSTRCMSGGFSEMDLLFFTEVMPQWNDAHLANLITPESLMFGNIAAVAAQPIDCAAASVDEPIDKLFWVAGCWGGHYPLTGNTIGAVSPVNESSLLSSRMLFTLHRLGFIKRHMGDDAVCDGKRAPLMVKSMYRMQMMYPMPEAEVGFPGGSGPGSGDENGSAQPAENSTSEPGQQVQPIEIVPNQGTCCHPIGKSTMLWGEWRTVPGSGEDFVYLLWKWHDCCIGISF